MEHNHGCKACGACNQCDRCTHCGCCRNCGRYVALRTFTPALPYYGQPIWPTYPVYRSTPDYYVSGHIQTTATIAGISGTVTSSLGGGNVFTFKTQ